MKDQNPQSGLKLSQVSVKYDDLVAVKPLDLQIKQGEICALLGPSGCGKSSLLRAVAGLEPLASGQIFWDGQDYSRLPIHRRGFSLMFQDGQLFPNRTVAGNVAYGIRFRGGHKNREERIKLVRELLRLVGLPGYEDRPIDTLSGGQAQRVSLARCLASNPSLLLLDEPLSALDRAWRETLVVQLREIIKSQQLTAIYVTHDQDEAFSLADRVVVLDRGKVLDDQPSDRIWQHPASQAVAEFLGYSPFLEPEAARDFNLELNEDELLGLGPGALRMVSADESSKYCGQPLIAAVASPGRISRGRYLVPVEWQAAGRIYQAVAQNHYRQDRTITSDAQPVKLRLELETTCVVKRENR